MGISVKNAYADQVPATDTTLYTCPANKVARVLKCTACNDTTTVPTITFHKVPSSESVGDEYLILNALALDSKETRVLYEVEGQVLDAGDIISAIASSANQVSVMLDVVESS